MFQEGREPINRNPSNPVKLRTQLQESQAEIEILEDRIQKQMPTPSICNTRKSMLDQYNSISEPKAVLKTSIDFAILNLKQIRCHRKAEL